MFAEVLGFLREDGWPVAPGTYDGLPCIRTRFLGSEDAWECRARPYDPFGQLAFESVLPVTVAPEHLPAVTELVIRANWRLLTGAFQLDLDSAELVFRSMLFISDGVAVPDGLCRGLVYSNVLTVDRCLAEFKAAAVGEDPHRAYQRLAL
ncbi:MAG TPA: YbjN domain-containing protein [Microlunatus sp.]